MKAFFNARFVPSERCYKGHSWSLIFGLTLIFLPYVEFTGGSLGFARVSLDGTNKWAFYFVVATLHCYNLIVFYAHYAVEALIFEDVDLEKTAECLEREPGSRKSTNGHVQVVRGISLTRLENSPSIIFLGKIRAAITLALPILLFCSVVGLYSSKYLWNMVLFEEFCKEVLCQTLVRCF